MRRVAAGCVRQQGGGLVPPGSRVLVRLGLMYPDSASLGHTYPLMASGASSPEYLACTLEVLSPGFRGRRFRHWFLVNGAATPAQRAAMDLARRQIRALIEAACRIRPDDDSPRAMQARIVRAWTDLEGLEFPVVTGVARCSGRDGRVCLVNTLEAIVTMRDPDFACLRDGGERISGAPLPEACPAAGFPVRPSAQEPAGASAGSSALTASDRQTAQRPALKDARKAGAAGAAVSGAAVVRSGAAAGSAACPKRNCRAAAVQDAAAPPASGSAGAGGSCLSGQFSLCHKAWITDPAACRMMAVCRHVPVACPCCGVPAC